MGGVFAGVDLFEVIEHELGHVLGYTPSDADAHSFMNATLPVALATRSLATIGGAGRSFAAPEAACSTFTIGLPAKLRLASAPLVSTAIAQASATRRVAGFDTYL